MEINPGSKSNIAPSDQNQHRIFEQGDSSKIFVEGIFHLSPHGYEKSPTHEIHGSKN